MARKNYKPRTCLGCRVKYTPRTYRQKYCSRACGEKHKPRFHEKHHYKVRRALKNRLLTKPEKCAHCSRRKPLVAHHEVYDDAGTTIIWLCHKCHGIEHSNDPLRKYGIHFKPKDECSQYRRGVCAILGCEKTSAYIVCREHNTNVPLCYSHYDHVVWEDRQRGVGTIALFLYDDNHE